jgi:hypothetical protein
LSISFKLAILDLVEKYRLGAVAQSTGIHLNSLFYSLGTL